MPFLKCACVLHTCKMDQLLDSVADELNACRATVERQAHTMASERAINDHKRYALNDLKKRLDIEQKQLTLYIEKKRALLNEQFQKLEKDRIEAAAREMAVSFAITRINEEGNRISKHRAFKPIEVPKAQIVDHHFDVGKYKAEVQAHLDNAEPIPTGVQSRMLKFMDKAKIQFPIIERLVATSLEQAKIMATIQERLDILEKKFSKHRDLKDANKKHIQWLHRDVANLRQETNKHLQATGDLHTKFESHKGDFNEHQDMFREHYSIFLEHRKQFIEHQRLLEEKRRRRRFRWLRSFRSSN